MVKVGLATKIVMPRLSLTMKEGTVVQWFKNEGETVQKGEPLVEVLSEKVTYDVEAPESGVLRKIIAGEGSNVPIDQAIGIIAAPDEPITTELETPTPALAQLPKSEGVASSKPEIVAETEAAQRVPASPAAKRLARELGVDLAQATGTGPDGRIVEDDVKRLAEQAIGRPRVREIIPLVGIRKTTAERVSLSARTAPHSTITMEVDMTYAAKLHGAKAVSYTDLLVKVVATALREHALLNSTLEDGQIKVFEDVNVGVAVATEKGLVVPVVHNADKLTVSEIDSAVKGLVEKARQGKLEKDDVSGGTFTITNLGMYGVDVFIPIINPPETAILGVGRVADKLMMVEREVKVKPVMELSLSFDHRVVDGAPAALFLQKIKQLLENETGI
jgi:pyruvate dehydrogenase E2 component (dihydrolipoamide acetyltransferase)